MDSIEKQLEREPEKLLIQMLYNAKEAPNKHAAENWQSCIDRTITDSDLKKWDADDYNDPETLKNFLLVLKQKMRDCRDKVPKDVTNSLAGNKSRFQTYIEFAELACAKVLDKLANKEQSCSQSSKPKLSVCFPKKLLVLLLLAMGVTANTFIKYQIDVAKLDMADKHKEITEQISVRGDSNLQKLGEDGTYNVDGFDIDLMNKELKEVSTLETKSPALYSFQNRPKFIRVYDKRENKKKWFELNEKTVSIERIRTDEENGPMRKLVFSNLRKKLLNDGFTTKALKEKYGVKIGEKIEKGENEYNTLKFTDDHSNSIFLLDLMNKEGDESRLDIMSNMLTGKIAKSKVIPLQMNMDDAIKNLEKLENDIAEKVKHVLGTYDDDAPEYRAGMEGIMTSCYTYGFVTQWLGDIAADPKAWKVQILSIKEVDSDSTLDKLRLEKEKPDQKEFTKAEIQFALDRLTTQYKDILQEAVEEKDLDKLKDILRTIEEYEGHQETLWNTVTYLVAAYFMFFSFENIKDVLGIASSVLNNTFKTIAATTLPPTLIVLFLCYASPSFLTMIIQTFRAGSESRAETSLWPAAVQAGMLQALSASHMRVIRQARFDDDF